MLTQEQYAARRTGIGGSESGAILGLSEHRTAIDVYLAKILPPEMLPDEPTEAMIWGNVLEDAIAGEYARRNNVDVRRANATLRHPQLPMMLGNIDRRITGAKRGLEVKTSTAWLSERWGEPGSEDVPDGYWCQAQHYMEITGYEQWDLAVLIGGNELRQYRIHRNRDFGDTLRETVATFWRDYVVPKVVPPVADGTMARKSIEALQQLYPGTDGTEVDLSELGHWHEVLVDVNEKLRRFEILRDECRAHLLSAMGSATIGKIDGVGQYRRKLIDREGYTVEPTSYVDFRFTKAKRGTKDGAAAEGPA